MDKKLYTIGHSTHSTEHFISLLVEHGVTAVCDVRSSPYSRMNPQFNRETLKASLKGNGIAYVFLGQELGARSDNPACYVLKKIADIDYVHLPELAPTKDILDAFKKRKGDWDDYERDFLELMQQRQIEQTVSKDLLNEGCLLCSEDKPHHCHRRLVADYLKEKWQQVDVEHLT